jgi:hypothetical protein
MKNNKFLYIFLLTILFPIYLQAQRVEDAFVSMPDEYYLSLPTAQRKEMVRAFKQDSVHSRKNLFRGNSEITSIDSVNQYMSISNSPSARVELKVLPGKPGYPSYFALVFTACAKICDSNIGFYSTNWSFLKNSLLPKVSIYDFLDTEKIEADGKKTAEVAEQFDIVFLETRFVQNGNNIEVTLNSEKFLDKESYQLLKKYLKGNCLLFKWNFDIYVKDNCYWNDLTKNG